VAKFSKIVHLPKLLGFSQMLNFVLWVKGCLMAAKSPFEAWFLPGRVKGLQRTAGTYADK
jgi:hypothetical protein